MRASIYIKQVKYAIASMLLASSLISNPAVAAETIPPNELIEQTANQMITALNNDREQIKQNPKHAQQLVEQILLPHIDIITSSKWVLGKYWNAADKQQKLTFIREFRSLLLRFYSSALAEYLNTNSELLDPNLMKVHPLRASEAETRVIVRADVLPKDGKTIPVIYHMHKTHRGWKVYDVSVEGVSVITTYKTSFATEIEQKGLNEFLASLKDRNEKLLLGQSNKNGA